jgi:monofunctional biosynthetic peptidoglycan transglycosylase
MSGDRRRARQAGERPSRTRRWLRRLSWLGLVLVAASVMQVAVLRFVDPPFSAFMAERQLGAWAAGDWGFRIAYDWRDLRTMAPSLPLALVAAEDQRFPLHHGFDFEAIRKAQAHNERMQARAERRNQPVKHIRGASTISQQTAKNLFLWQGSGPTRWLR